MTSLEKVIDLFQTSSFKESFEEYKSKNNKEISGLIDFLDSIETNKKYYRIGVQKNKKYKRNNNEDTENIKTINSLVNKLTGSNYTIIKSEIINIVNKDYLVPYIIENLIEKSILHHRYTELYVSIIKEINIPNKNKIIINLCDKYFNRFFTMKSQKEDSSYEQLCKENKNIDNIIGLSILISHLEKELILINYIEKIMGPFMDTIENINDTELFKMLTSLYSISQIHYKEIPNKYKTKLESLKKSTQSSKIKFKIMDILRE